jgi:hypothetical protein
MTMQVQYLRRAQAAEYLKSKYGFGATKTLAKLATLGGGPKFRMTGRFPVYALEDLDNWALGRMGGLVSSTSEARTNRRKAPATETCAGA